MEPHESNKGPSPLQVLAPPTHLMSTRDCWPNLKNARPPHMHTLCPCLPPWQKRPTWLTDGESYRTAVPRLFPLYPSSSGLESRLTVRINRQVVVVKKNGEKTVLANLWSTRHKCLHGRMLSLEKIDNQLIGRRTQLGKVKFKLGYISHPLKVCGVLLLLSELHLKVQLTDCNWRRLKTGQVMRPGWVVHCIN